MKTAKNHFIASSPAASILTAIFIPIKAKGAIVLVMSFKPAKNEIATREIKAVPLFRTN